MRLRLGSKANHVETLKETAEQGLRRIRMDGEAEDAAGMYEEALHILARSKVILEGTADGVYVADPQGCIQLWNNAAERLTGRKESRVLGRACAEVLGLMRNGARLDCSNGCALLCPTAGDQATGVEVEREQPGGRKQRLIVNASALMNADGSLEEVIHSVRDVTAIKRADEAKTMFLATASHELKTPLTVILGFAQALSDGWLVEESERTNALAAIEKRAKELSKIVDRLLMTGRIESGRITLELKSVCLQEILPERAQALSTATEREIITEIADDLPDVVGDVQAIATVIDHLLDNAVKYAPDGGPVTLVVRARGNHVLVDITDNGIGMSPEEAAHCFESFWQAEQSDIRRFGGTGIGLYIVKSLVDGMGGAISVRSGLGEGTTFTVSFTRASTTIAPRTVTRSTEPDDPGVGRRTMIQEFMRQLGVPDAGGGGG